MIIVIPVRKVSGSPESVNFDNVTFTQVLSSRG